MRKTTKIWLVVAACLVLLGAVIFTAAVIALDFDLTNLSTHKFEGKTYKVDGDFENITVDTTISAVTFMPSVDGKCRVVCAEMPKITHSVSVKDSTLVIETKDSSKWYDYIGFFIGDMRMTVYLPQNEFKSLVMKTDTGDVDIPANFSFENANIESDTADIDFLADALVDVKLSTDTGDITVNSVLSDGDIYVETDTGKITLTDVKCNKLSAESDTGKISLSNTIAKDSFSIENNTGDVRFEKSDAQKIFVETDTGNVTGTLLSDKVFITETSTGDVSVPKTTTGGRCEITTSTGNIKIEIE